MLSIPRKTKAIKSLVDLCYDEASVGEKIFLSLSLCHASRMNLDYVKLCYHY